MVVMYDKISIPSMPAFLHFHHQLPSFIEPRSLPERKERPLSKNITPHTSTDGGSSDQLRDSKRGESTFNNINIADKADGRVGGERQKIERCSRMIVRRRCLGSFGVRLFGMSNE
jgi:hypothetical protein